MTGGVDDRGALRARLALLQDVLESAENFFSVDRTYSYTAFNRKHAAVMKAMYGAEIVLGTSVLDHMTVEADRTKAKSNLDRALGGETFVDEAFSGEEARNRRYIEVWHYPVRGDRGDVVAVAVFVKEVTERRRIEEALRESEAHFRALAETTPVGIFIVQDDRYTYVNPAGERLAGLSADRLLQMSAMDLVHPDFRELVLSRRTARLAGEPDVPDQYEIELATRDGAERWVQITAGAFALRGGPAVVVTMVDVTAQRRLRELQVAIYEISEATQATSGLPELFAAIHRVVGRLMNVGSIFIALYDQADDLLTFPYFAGETGGPPVPFPPGKSLSAYVMRTGRPLLATPEVRDALRAAGEVALEVVGDPPLDWLGAPLRVGQRTTGVLVVQSYSGAVRYGEAEVEILSFVSRQVAQAIDRKRDEEALRESEERFRGAFEDAAVGMALVGLDGRWQRVNASLCELVGYSEPELLGTTFQDITYREDLDASLEALKALLAGGSHTMQLEKRYVHKRGHLVWVLVSISLVRDGKRNPLYFIAQIQDVSGLKRAEAALLQAQKMEAVGRLAGGVAHDFNNLLQAMLSHTQLLRAFQTDAQRVAPVIGELEAQIRRAALLTRQLLLFSRRESAKFEPLNLNLVVDDATRMLRRIVREDIAFRLEPCSEPLRAAGDRGQLDQVLMNLVVNAADAMPGGGAITLRTGCEGDAVWFEVQDTGTGIPEEILPRIFEPFFTTKAVGKGSGLGLAVVHGIVDSHRGTVEVESRVNVGTNVRVVLPRSAPGPEPAAPTEDGPARWPTGSGERLLVVEDEESARRSLMEILTMLGYEVRAVGSAEEAGLLPLEPRFDLLLTDLILPGASGADLARGLVDRWPGLHVVVMSGYTDDVEIRRGISRGEVRFLQKPFDIQALASELRAALHDEATPGP